MWVVGVQSGSVQFVGVGCKVGVPENWGCGYVGGVPCFEGVHICT